MSPPSTLHALDRRVEVGNGLGVGVLRIFQIGHCDRALVVEQLGTRQLFVGKLCVGLELLVIRERLRQIGAIDEQ